MGDFSGSSAMFKACTYRLKVDVGPKRLLTCPCVELGVCQKLEWDIETSKWEYPSSIIGFTGGESHMLEACGICWPS